MQADGGCFWNLRSLFMINVKWESIILAEALMTFIGIQSGPAALFEFNFPIILLIYFIDFDIMNW